MVETKIDTNLYSRQIGTFGLETMGKLIKMKVLIIGMRGLGAEVAKNLILAGPASVDLYDPTLVTLNDLTSNFCLREEHVGKASRAEVSRGLLAELNPYVKTNVLTSFNPADVANYNVVCFTEMLTQFEDVVEIDKLCRAHKVGFIIAETLGAVGYIFLDYGEQFLVTDADGEPTKNFIISNISQEGIVTVHEDKRHSFQDGDYVKFVEVQGMTELNNREPVQITVLSPLSFKLKLDCSSFSMYTRQGIVENVKVPKAVSYHSLAESVLTPAASSQFGCLETPDLRCFGRSEQLHIAIRAVHAFRTKHARYPEFADQVEVLELATEINQKGKAAGTHFVDELDAKIVMSTAAYATCSISAQAAFFGGITAQEIVKFTGKYSPLKQWLHVDIFEALPEGDVDRTPMNSRYDD